MIVIENEKTHVSLHISWIFRPLNLRKVLIQTGKNQVPQWTRQEKSNSSPEVTVAGRCRYPQLPQQTTTRKTLQRRTHLATVVCTCQVRMAYLYSALFSSNVKMSFSLYRLTEIDITHVHTYTIIITMISKVVPVCAEVLESFMATREAMQVQQSVTVYESFGTSTLPSSMESPVSPERELDRKQQWEKHGESDESLSFPAACHLVVSRCLFLLLGVRPAWVEPSERENIQAMNSRAR